MDLDALEGPFQPKTFNNSTRKTAPDSTVGIPTRLDAFWGTWAMLTHPAGLEEGNLLGLQDILGATSAPSQPQQLSSSIIPWWSMKLALIPGLCPHFGQLWLKIDIIFISFSVI